MKDRILSSSKYKKYKAKAKKYKYTDSKKYKKYKKKAKKQKKKDKIKGIKIKRTGGVYYYYGRRMSGNIFNINVVVITMMLSLIQILI